MTMRYPWLLCALLLAICSTPLLAQVDDAMDKARLERMLEDGDTILIAQVFKRHPGQVLPFIDSYLEGGLKIREEGGDDAAVMASYRTGVKFAEIAREAFREDVFLSYAASFASWSPKEQKNFRLGQQEYRTGRQVAKDDPTKALEHYDKSWALANSLGDSWGKAMAASGQAQMMRALDKPNDAINRGRVSADLYQRLRLEGSAVRVMLMCGEVLNEQDPERGFEYFRTAWRMMRDKPKDNELRKSLLDTYAGALERVGRAQDAKSLRESGDLAGR